MQKDYLFWLQPNTTIYFVSDFTSYQYGGGASLSPSMASDLRSTSGEFVMNNAGWINTVPLSSNTSTLSKRSNRSKRMVNPDIYVKDYLKKRALILSLLVSCTGVLMIVIKKKADMSF